MEWLGPHFFIDLPGNGHLLLNCSHNPFLVLLAYLVAGALIFVGVLLTLWAWRVRRLARGMQSRQNSTIYYEDW
jgi:hypothetical protein